MAIPGDIGIALQEQEKVEAAVKKDGHQQSLPQEPGRFAGHKPGQACIITHQYAKGGMRWYRQEHAQDAGCHTMLKYIHYIFESGKAHAYYDGINNAIKGFIECPLPIGVKTQDKKFATLFTKGHQAIRPYYIIGDGIRKDNIVQLRLELALEDRGWYCTYYAQQERQEQWLKGLPVIFIF